MICECNRQKHLCVYRSFYSSEVKCEDCVSCESLSLCIYSLMSLSVFEHLKTHYNRGVAMSGRSGYNRIVGYRLLASTFIHCYRPQTKFPKVMFLHLSVSYFVHGGVCIQRGWVCIKGGLHPRWDLHPRGVCIWEGGPASRGSASRRVGQTPHRILRDMVNKLVVCILLECILV